MTLNSRMRPLLGLAVFFAVVFLLGRYTAQQDVTRSPYYLRFEVFGTFGEMILYHEKEDAKAAAKQILEQLQDLHNRFNTFDSDSELSRLNARAHDAPVQCSEPLWEILQHARRGHALSEGAFDVTVAPLMELWGFRSKRGEWPDESEIEAVRGAVGLDSVSFNPSERTVRFMHPRTRIDLGGIAKGYALDRAVEILDEHKLDKGLINLGGNIRALQPPRNKKSAYRIGVRDPLKPDAVLGRVALRDSCVSTSGGYEKFRVLDGKTVSHVVDPRTGRPVQTRVGATVVTPRGVDSDMFSTAALVGGGGVARALTSAVSDTRILITEADADREPRHIEIDWQWASDTPPNWIQKTWRTLRSLW